MDDLAWVFLGLFLGTLAFIRFRGKRPCKKLILKDGTTAEQGTRCPMCKRARDTIKITDFTTNRFGAKPTWRQFCTVCHGLTPPEWVDG